MSSVLPFIVEKTCTSHDPINFGTWKAIHSVILGEDPAMVTNQFYQSYKPSCIAGYTPRFFGCLYIAGDFPHHTPH